ncbi:E3 ubiquitin-protein ligase WAVH1-like [Oryza glaberrima]|uniref:E3 ubiquitin-protein ligase WAVH1-like n=1 Tax=Oryza glaberrima TaxID=4538 RepID=UPI00224C2D75|nr:E3 ubiquitin-protein ligase WAVH1-like [Oryza glaberrima]
MSQAQAANTVQVTAYAKVDAVHVGAVKQRPGVPVLVRVVAPPPAAASSERAPIDLVAVLDVSCCGGLGPVNRMDLLKKAMGFVIDKLGEHDRLAVVPVQASAAVAEKHDLVEMNAEGRKEATRMVQSSLTVTGENKLSTALKKAATILEGRKDHDKKRPGFIVLISDGDDASVLRDAMNLNCSVHAFGFRDAHNARAMHRIANTSAGTYGILNDGHDGLADAFVTSVGNITSIVAVDAEVSVSCSGAESTAAKLTAIESGRFKHDINGGGKRGTIQAGALQAGAVRSFLVYVDNVGDDELEHLPSMLTVGVQYEDRSTTTSQNAAENQAGREMARRTAQVVVVRDGDEHSRLVAAEIVRVAAMRIVGEIIKNYGDNGRALAGAADELHKQWSLLKKSEFAKEAAPACFVSALDAEMSEMEATLRRSSGMSYMLSWQTCHSLQHLQHARSSSSPSATTSVAAAAKGNGGASAVAAAARQSFTAGGAAAMGKFVWSGAHHGGGGGGGGGGERKRKYQSSEMEMIEQRLAYWTKVKCELPPMHHDGECPDHMTTIFRDASRDSIDRAMFHDVFLAVVHATGRRSSKSGGGGDSSCGL